MTSHRYLMDEHPHFFYPTLAEKLGLNEAIVLQQIHSWIQTYLKDPEKYREQHYHDGAWWTWDSYPDWHKKLPYLSESTIRRTLTGLREMGILKVGNYNTLKIDRTFWYTINYDEYDKFWSDQDAKIASPSVQNEQMEDTNLDRPLPDSSSDPSALEEPATPDSPPDSLFPGMPTPDAASHLRTVYADDVAETEAMFDKTSSKKLSKKEFESRHNGLAAVTGQEMKVSHDIPGEPWCNAPVEEWCKLAGKSYEGMSIPTRIKLGGIFYKIGVATNSTPAQVAEAIGNFKAEHPWWKYDFDWPSDGFCNRLGMMLVPNALPEPGETLVSVQPAEPAWLGAST